MKCIVPVLFAAAAFCVASPALAQPQRILLIDPPEQQQQQQQSMPYVPRYSPVLVEQVPIAVPPRVIIIQPARPVAPPSLYDESGGYLGLMVARHLDFEGGYSSVGVRFGLTFEVDEIGLRATYLFDRQSGTVGLEMRHRFSHRRVFQPYIGVAPGLTWAAQDNGWSPHLELELQAGFDIQIGRTRFGLSTFSTLDYGPISEELRLEKGIRLSISWVF